MRDTTVTYNMGFLGWLAILFIALKLTGFITWSWWWVTAPLWGGLAFALVVCAVVALCFMVVRVARR